jgi:hypothetical protein
MSGDDVQDTLNELERKLRELQAELSVPAPAAQPPPPPEPPPPPPPPRGGLQDQLEELLRFREQLTEAAKKLVEDYSRVLEQITRATGGDEPAAPAPPPPPTPASGHVTFPVPPPAAPSAESTLFSGQVTIDAGPFADIAALARFEEAVRQVALAEDVHVRSFDDERAVIDLRLASEAPLVFELRRASDLAFDVDHAEAGRLSLTIHAGDLPFPVRP